MLSLLKIRNLALVERLDWELGGGLVGVRPARPRRPRPKPRMSPRRSHPQNRRRSPQRMHRPQSRLRLARTRAATAPSPPRRLPQCRSLLPGGRQRHRLRRCGGGSGNGAGSGALTAFTSRTTPTSRVPIVGSQRAGPTCRGSCPALRTGTRSFAVSRSLATKRTGARRRSRAPCVGPRASTPPSSTPPPSRPRLLRLLLLAATAATATMVI